MSSKNIRGCRFIEINYKDEKLQGQGHEIKLKLQGQKCPWKINLWGHRFIEIKLWGWRCPQKINLEVENL